MSVTAGPVILNVDDQEAQRYVKSRDLRFSGFTVIEAETGAEALRLVEERKPSVVLLDVELPDISGYEVCRYIKGRWPEVMVLMTSATFTTPERRTLGLDSGADTYLVQPAEPLELAAAVNAMLRIRRSEDELRLLNDTLEQRVRDRVRDLADANARLMSESAQRQKAEAALVQSQKMEAIGQLTGGLAHDFNNLLTAVVGNLDLIRARSTEPTVRRWAENGFTAAMRGSKLTSQLLVFSRTKKFSTAPVEVNALIIGMRELLNQALGAGITVRTELAADLSAATADANQLELAILNLSINARDAMPDGGEIIIKTAIAPNGDAIELSVADSGTGMPPDVIRRAFDPFFTTKPPGKGTGLGLSQVYGIVRQSGGEVTIDSEVGKGTTVTIALPRAARATTSEERTDAVAAPSVKFEKILLVDDDPDVNEIICRVLSDFGYHVQPAASGAEALSVMDAFAPDLMVVDFSMPDMNGTEVVLAARRRDARLKILFLSGYADSEALEKAVGKAPLLRKPFRPIELAAAVRSALDAPRV